MKLAHTLPFRRPAGPRRLPLFALLAAMFAVAACDDPFKVKANYENGSQAFQVYALSGTPTNLSSALLLPVRSVTRVDGSFAFDVAFDIPLAFYDARLDDGVTMHQDIHDREFPEAGNPRGRHR